MTEPLPDSVRAAALILRDELHSLLTACAAWNEDKQAEFLKLPVTQIMTDCLQRLAATGCVGPANQLPSQVLWDVAGDLLQQGTLQLRAREKPRGYAGDDELLRNIFEGKLAESPLGRAFDRFFLQQDAPRAVIERTLYAARMCEEVLNTADTDSTCRIAVIGAGPAIELEQAMYRRTASSQGQSGVSPLRRTQVTLLDLDELALIAAHERLSQIAPEVKLIALRENLFRLGKQPKRAVPLIESDLIICLGLLDYLKDEDASELLRVCYQSLRPGGRMLFGNFAPQCQARSYMEWIGNWYLKYRTEPEFMALAQAAGIDEQGCRIVPLVDGACLLFEAQRVRD